MRSSFSYGELEKLLQKHGFLIYGLLTPDDVQRDVIDKDGADLKAFEHVNYFLAVRKNNSQEGEFEIMPMWNPWRGCKKCSEGCLHCYIHKGDTKRGVDTGMIVKTKDFDKPIAQLKKGGYKMKPGLVYLGFSTDFLIEEADVWRGECWKMIKERSDCSFLFLTKRIERFAQCMPEDWADGYENVTVCCTIENQRNADKKLSVFQTLPIKHKCITAQPLLERVNLEPYLDGVELVVVGGESDKDARPLDYDWVLDIREQCIRNQVDFEFRQCGTHFVKDGKQYKLQTRDLCRQARLAGIDYRCRIMICQ